MSATTGSKRNGLIDLYKFFFAETVVCHHSIYLPGFSGEWGEHFVPLKAAYIAVEFFFICSGYYLARRAFSQPPVKDLEKIGRLTLGQVWKRIRSIYLYFAGGVSSRFYPAPSGV